MKTINVSRPLRYFIKGKKNENVDRFQRAPDFFEEILSDVMLCECVSLSLFHSLSFSLSHTHTYSFFLSMLFLFFRLSTI